VWGDEIWGVVCGAAGLGSGGGGGWIEERRWPGRQGGWVTNDGGCGLPIGYPLPTRVVGMGDF
jgi:hypothetical protein